MGYRQIVTESIKHTTQNSILVFVKTIKCSRTNGNILGASTKAKVEHYLAAAGLEFLMQILYTNYICKPLGKMKGYIWRSWIAKKTLMTFKYPSALEKVAGVINDACVIFDKQVIAEMEHDRIKSQYLP